jgi:group I intron endonuclease
MNIYVVTNQVNGKQYVGQSHRTPTERWKEHLRETKRGCLYLFHRAIRKHGPGQFQVKLLATANDQVELDRLEEQWIETIQSLSPKGYNTKVGKQGRWSEEIRKRVSEKMKGQPKSAETRRKMSEAKKGKPTWIKGKKMPPEYGALRGAKLKGRKMPEEQRLRLKEHRGWKHTPETIAKLRAAGVARGMSIEVSKLGWEIRRGKPRSEETRAKLRAAWVIRKQRTNHVDSNDKPGSDVRKPVL